MPDATMADVAGDVSGASTDLVERVLREYGDPAAVESDPDGQTASDGGSAAVDGQAAASETGSSDSPSETTETADDAGEPPGSSAEETPDDRQQSDAEEASEPERTASSEEASVVGPGELTGKERAVLEVVVERPTATQQEVADVLGVSRATVSKRASGIEGLDWQRRAAFVERLFDDEAVLTRGAGDSSTADRDTIERSDARTDGDRHSSAKTAADRATGADSTAEVLSRLDRIEDRLERVESSEETAGGFADPELAHKVVHACMESEHVSGDEELRVVAAVLNGEPED